MVVEVVADESSVLASRVETAFVGLDTCSEKLLELDGDVTDVVVAAARKKGSVERNAEAQKRGEDGRNLVPIRNGEADGPAGHKGSAPTKERLKF